MTRDAILLVGGGGFIGAALAHALSADGREVHALGPHVVPGHIDGIFGHRGSQSDAALVRPLLEHCGTVIHLASTTTPGSSAGAPEVEQSGNLQPLSVFIDTLASTSPCRLMFVSSGGAIYGNPARLPADESLPPQPLSPHAAGKAAAEAMLSEYARHHAGAALVVLRPSNVYGPGQPLRSGFGIVRTLLEKARTGAPVEIWGSDRAVRDYLYIDDFVAACRRLLDRPEIAGTFNVGSGEGVALSALIEHVARVTGRPFAVSRQPGRGVDVESIILDSGRLQAATEWSPEVTLDAGLRSTWQWLQDR